MLNIKHLAKYLLTSFLFTASLPLYSDSFNNGQRETVHFSEDHLFNQAARAKNTSNQLRLEDFAGKWVFKLESIGGVSGPLSTGVSLSGIFQAQIKNNGKGHVNGGTAAFYSGVTGEVHVVELSKSSTIKIAITDKENGLGTLTLRIPNLFNQDKIFIIPFVTTKSKKNGNVIELDGIRTEVLPEDVICQKALIKVTGKRASR